MLKENDPRAVFPKHCPALTKQNLNVVIQSSQGLTHSDPQQSHNALFVPRADLKASIRIPEKDNSQKVQLNNNMLDSVSMLGTNLPRLLRSRESVSTKYLMQTYKIQKITCSFP